MGCDTTCSWLGGRSLSDTALSDCSQVHMMLHVLTHGVKHGVKHHTRLTHACMCACCVLLADCVPLTSIPSQGCCMLLELFATSIRNAMPSVWVNPTPGTKPLLLLLLLAGRLTTSFTRMLLTWPAP